MDCRGNVLNLDIGCLQKWSFKKAKFWEKGRLQSYVTCGEVVELSMRQSLKKYIEAVVRRWWVIIGFLVGLLGIITGALGKTILLPYWAWVSIGIVTLIVAQFLAYHEVNKQLDEARKGVASAILDLESKIINLGGQSINMAMLFWRLGEYFLGGIKPGNIHGIIVSIFEEVGVYAGVDECSQVERNLMSRLRLLQLIENRQCWHLHTGYIEIFATSLGASVIKELEKKQRDMPWPVAVGEQVHKKEGPRKYGFD
jgi:hypothetical protein